MSNAADLAGFVPSIIPKDSINISGGVNVAGIVTASSFVKTGGTASQYLMADGSVSSGGGGDSATLGGISSTGYLRSDVADIKTSGNLTFNDNI